MQRFTPDGIVGNHRQLGTLEFHQHLPERRLIPDLLEALVILRAVLKLHRL